MAHTEHIRNHKEMLTFRHDLIRTIREFFWSKDFQDVETPLVVRLPGQEPHLSPMPVAVQNERGESFEGYLHTSPEYAMKKMLAAGFARIFSITKCFRGRESFGGQHNPEFTMIEWYRLGADMFGIMDDIDGLLNHIHQTLGARYPKSMQVPAGPAERMHMREVWKKYVDVDLDAYLTRESLFALCKQKGYQPKEDEPYEDLFYRIFLNEIEPKLIRPTIVHHYPAAMAALAKIDPDDPRYAERFELYINAAEIANAFSELTDADEQRRRLEAEQMERKKSGKAVYPIDEEFLFALKDIPSAGGIALGIDRLVQAFAGCKDLDDVIPLPASELFKHSNI